MFVSMYGIGCAACGHAVDAWIGHHMWPCGCPAGVGAEPVRPPQRELAASVAVGPLRGAHRPSRVPRRIPA